MKQIAMITATIGGLLTMLLGYADVACSGLFGVNSSLGVFALIGLAELGFVVLANKRPKAAGTLLVTSAVATFVATIIPYPRQQDAVPVLLATALPVLLGGVLLLVDARTREKSKQGGWTSRSADDSP